MGGIKTMENAKILLVEDKGDLVLVLRAILENKDHEVLFVENNLESALTKLNNNDFRDIDLAIVDGYFPDNADPRTEKFNGEFLSKKLREKHPNMKIISYSSVENCTYGDVNIFKMGKPSNLLKAIQRLGATENG